MYIYMYINNTHTHIFVHQYAYMHTHLAPNHLPPFRPFRHSKFLTMCPLQCNAGQYSISGASICTSVRCIHVCIRIYVYINTPSQTYIP